MLYYVLCVSSKISIYKNQYIWLESGLQQQGEKEKARGGAHLFSNCVTRSNDTTTPPHMWYGPARAKQQRDRYRNWGVRGWVHTEKKIKTGLSLLRSYCGRPRKTNRRPAEKSRKGKRSAVVANNNKPTQQRVQSHSQRKLRNVQEREAQRE